MRECTDKFTVRKYVKRCGLEEILNECYGVYESINDVNFEKLPSSFVIKDTLGGGGNSIIIVKDKENLEIDEIKKKTNKWISSSIYKKNFAREWVYEGRKHRIIIEKYIESKSEEGGLIDYKFLCFNGEIALVYVLTDRILSKGAGCGFFDTNFNQLPYTESDEQPLKRKVLKPSNFKRMKKIAETLSSSFPCARVDLYNTNGKVIFGEITFFDGSGYMTFNPDEVDFKLGNKFKLI